MVKGKIATLRDINEDKEVKEVKKVDEPIIEEIEDEHDTLFPMSPKKKMKEDIEPPVIKQPLVTPGITIKEAYINRLNGIIAIANEINTGKYKKLIRLASECKDLVDKL